MEEEFIAKFKGMVQSLSEDAARKIIQEELPGIIRKMQEPGADLSDYIDYNAAADMLGICKTTLHNYINSGKLSKHQLRTGGKPYLRRSEIMKLMKSTKQVKPNLN